LCRTKHASRLALGDRQAKRQPNRQAKRQPSTMPSAGPTGGKLGRVRAGQKAGLGLRLARHSLQRPPQWRPNRSSQGGGNRRSNKLLGNAAFSFSSVQRNKGTMSYRVLNFAAGSCAAKL
jgi:hypothetical protein